MRWLLHSLPNDCHKKMAVAYAIILMLFASASSKSDSGCYESIVSFGDSLADTGNLLLLRPADNQPRAARPPYGRTFFHRPTGRCSDGRLVIDFIAQSLGLPLVQPYVGGENDGRSFSRGVNFAVIGATALDNGYYEKIGIHNKDTNVSLGTQLDWFQQFVAAIPVTTDGRKFLQNSLVLVGEIGGNDYNFPIMQEANAEMIHTAEDYDPKTGCLNWLNKFSRYHNKLLRKELNRIQELHPHVAIIYADYYNAAMRFYLSPNEFGFSTEEFLELAVEQEGRTITMRRRHVAFLRQPVVMILLHLLVGMAYTLQRQPTD
ncbi:hypothetical protein DH2020_017519 [Rehmannia glutinosa]|uniref:GDSL esterase/lipase n=1 Tax=Rehmannia glutinosa TaxID=99300 RepID=A0ABR0WS74_REHGL